MLALVSVGTSSRILMEELLEDKIKVNACSKYIQLFPKYSCVQESNIGVKINCPVFLVKDQGGKLFVMKMQRQGDQSDREVEVLRKLKGRPYVVQMQAEKAHDGLQGIVLEYASRKNLELVLQTSDYFSNPHNILIFFAKLIEGLQSLHQAGFVHSKLSIFNVVLNEQYDPMIIDFNLSQPVETRSNFKGIPVYMTPEMVGAMNNRQQIVFSEKIDIYSAGVILYFMYFHKYPIGHFEMDFEQMIDSAIIFPEGSSSLFMNIIKRCLQLEKNRNSDEQLLLFLKDSLKDFRDTPIVNDYYYTLRENNLSVYHKGIHEMSRVMFFMLVASAIIFSISIMFCYCQLCLFLMWSNMDVNRVSMPPSETNIEKRFADSIMISNANKDPKATPLN